MSETRQEPRATRAGRMRVLILGGAEEARLLAARVAAEPGVEGMISLAGRTREPLAQALPTRIGGFGGAEGLTRFLRDEAIDRVVDATHPFAARMSQNAQSACRAAGVPLVALHRAPWTPVAGDRWIDAADNAAAARALGAAPRRVFLTIGRQGVGDFRAAAHHFFLIRAIEAPEPSHVPRNAELLLSRGPFGVDEEVALMREWKIDVMVTKNSGGGATYAKMEAARRLGLDVVVIARPPAGAGAVVHDLDAAMAFVTAAA
jgi:precorrin-6A/cobalt-precorrin-6A reductase